MINSVSSQNPPSTSRRIGGGWLFALVVLCEALVACGLMIGQRVPDGHDGLQLFMYQFYFLNNARQSGQIAQWIPYIAHGSTANLWYAFNATMVQGVAIQVARWVPWIGSLYVFHFGIFVDQLMLVTGLWLWCRRFCEHPASVCFICICVVGSSLWIDQPTFNLHFYYAVPLMLHLGHRFLETGKWRYVGLAGNLLALQTLGNAAYAIPVTTFVIGAYFGLYCALGRRGTAARWVHVRFSPWAIPAVLGSMAALAGAYAILALGGDQIFSLARMGNGDGSVSLNDFLTYAVNGSYWQWMELMVRIPGMIDYTHYAGLLTVPLALIGLSRLRRDQAHLAILGALLFFFGQGNTVIGSILYYAWPGMKFYRHLTAVTGFFKIFLCMVAGIGFDQLFIPQTLVDSTSPGNQARRNGFIAGMAALLLLGQTFFLAEIATNRDLAIKVLKIMVGASNNANNVFLNSTIDTRQPCISAILAGWGCLLLLARYYFWKSRRALSFIAAIALVFVLVDLYEFKINYLMVRSDSFATAEDLLRNQPMQFVTQRVDKTDLSTGRGAELTKVDGMSWARYECINAFIFSDEVSCSFRCDFLQKPLYRLIQAYCGLPPDGSGAAILMGQDGREIIDRVKFLFKFPMYLPSQAKVTGMTPGRVQFFSSAVEAPGMDAVASWLQDPAFIGDALLLQPAGSENSTDLGPGRAIPDEAKANHRLNLEYQVRRFDANNLTLAVHNDSGHSAWLMYCDSWDPGWSATVNGKPSPVRCADLAYKAVQLEAGDNLVEFHFVMPWLSTLATLFAINALGWLIGLAWMSWRLVRGF